MPTCAGRACATQPARASGVLATRSTCLDPERQTSIQAFETSAPTRTSPLLPCIVPPGSLRTKALVGTPDCIRVSKPRLPFACQTATPAGPGWPPSLKTNPRSERPPASPSYQRWAPHDAIHGGITVRLASPVCPNNGTSDNNEHAPVFSSIPDLPFMLGERNCSLKTVRHSRFATTFRIESS